MKSPREATVNSKSTEAKAITYRPKRAALNWTDYLVIAATAITFAAVVAANNPHAARAQSRADLIRGYQLPEQASALPDSPELIKAKIGLLANGHWG
jgi:hypothetical protein